MAPRVAKDIISYCPSCRMDLNHTVVAVDGDKVVRVLCLTCKKEHAFRLPLELRPSSTKKRTTKTPVPRKATADIDNWETDMERIRDLSAKVYTLDGFYEAGEKIDHHVFGLGVVKRLISTNKMEVLFEKGVKLLVRETSRTDPPH